MGQAKSRGTLEQRIAQSKKKCEIADAARLQREDEAEKHEAQRVASMPPDERKQYSERKHRRNMATATMIGMMLALSTQGRGRNV
jgi:hypothetical protein